MFHAHAFDATNILFDAIEQVAIDNDDGSLSIPRRRSATRCSRRAGTKG